MINMVLQGISIYWMHLFLLPTSITQKINSILAKFLCSRTSQGNKIHLIKFTSLSHPTNSGGWGIRDTNFFNSTLLSYNIWMVFNVSCLWGGILKGKYLFHQSLEEWFVYVVPCRSGKLVIWSSLMNDKCWLRGNL